ncbi:hypothetical protein DVH24_001953 [Malus domestica]|uniref:Protein kinase domain-containing protein n=1 Tax=Malus domestica TaxID=3750 RepID=A0A498I8Q2_MALDO|nr:hypothetical protein DVH24_001953 [Malus domestica]
MALIRRRQLKSLAPLSDHRLRFSLPLHPPELIAAANYSSASISVADLETLELLGQGNGGKVYKLLGDIKILMEFMDSGTLETLLIDNGAFSEAKLAHVPRQVLSDRNYLHTHNITHRANLLVNTNMEVKIPDFGVSKIVLLTSDGACSSPIGQSPDWPSLMLAICFGEPPSLPAGA